MAEAEAWVIIPLVKNKGTECVLKMQPIVLCKNCKYYKGNGYCNRSGIHLEVNDYWFCADGERKEGR